VFVATESDVERKASPDALPKVLERRRDEEEEIVLTEIVDTGRRRIAPRVPIARIVTLSTRLVRAVAGGSGGGEGKGRDGGDIKIAGTDMARECGWKQ
jgi:hypothetical protein